MYCFDKVNSFVGAFHDAVILYALAVNETFAANANPRNGTDITRRMWNRSFQGLAIANI
jgi:atrial natriuretic peptide receptor A